LLVAPKITLFIPSFGDGGVERMMVNLANGFAEARAVVHLIVKAQEGPYLDRLNPKVVKVPVTSDDNRGIIEEFHAYLLKERPDIVMSSKERDDHLALAVKDRLNDKATRFILRVGTSLSARPELRSRNPLRCWFQKRRMKGLLARADGVIAISHGVAEDLTTCLDTPPEIITVLPNPTITPDLLALARQPAEHPWMNEQEVPVIMGIGRLGRAKDFSTLIRAFALLRKERHCRLIILGKGRQKDNLSALIHALGIGEDAHLAGFVQNPYAYLARAKLFVLSSRWEGLPNVLTEALAVGTPVVSTDCPSGPREILQNGRYGPLVPPGDIEALAKAMAATLDNPLSAEFLREAVKDYTVGNSARAYLKAFGLTIPEEIT
jgi:glycosyltransferase involved in cell wall biosynthesis